MFCPYCGDQIPDESKFCPKCGKQMINTNQANTSSPNISSTASDSFQTNTFSVTNVKRKKRWSKKQSIIFGTIVGVIVIIVAIVGFTGANSSQDSITLQTYQSSQDVIRSLVNAQSGLKLNALDTGSLVWSNQASLPGYDWLVETSDGTFVMACETSTPKYLLMLTSVNPDDLTQAKSLMKIYAKSVVGDGYNKDISNYIDDNKNWLTNSNPHNFTYGGVTFAAGRTDDGILFTIYPSSTSSSS